MYLLSLPEYTSSTYLNMWCQLCSVMDGCAVAELCMVGLGVGVSLVGMPVIASWWAWVVARLNFSNNLMALQTFISSKLLINLLSFLNDTQSTQVSRCLVQCLRRDLLVHNLMTCKGITSIYRCLVQCLEKDWSVHYLVIVRDSATVDLERNAGVQSIPLLSSLVQCLGRDFLELGVFLPIALVLCQGLLQCSNFNIPPWLASLAAALLGCVVAPGFSVSGLLVLMPCLSSLLQLLAVCAVWQRSMLSFWTRKIVEFVEF